MTHLQAAVAYCAQFARTSPEFAACDGLITALIENATFDYADRFEVAEFLTRKAAL